MSNDDLAILAAVCWTGFGLLTYLIQYAVVSAKLSEIGQRKKFDEAVVSYAAAGPLAVTLLFRAVAVTNRRVARIQAEAAQLQAEGRIKLLTGPDPLDDYNECCRLKKGIQMEVERLEKDRAEASRRNWKDLYILQYMPELADLTDPEPAIVKEIESRLGRLAAALAKTDQRLAEAAAEERQRRAERRRAERRRAEREIQEDSLSDRAKLNVAARLAEQAAANGGGNQNPISTVVAINLWRHSSHCVDVEDDEGFTEMIHTAVQLASALQTNRYLQANYLSCHQRICSWLSSAVGDARLATEVAGINDPVAAGITILCRLELAQQALDMYDNELLKLRCELDKDSLDPPMDEEPAELTTETETKA